MLPRLKTPLVLFYGSTLVIVVALFQAITSYGEKHLKAPPNINGRYVSTAAVPNCQPTQRLVLFIQQSGLYLHGSIRFQPEAEAIASETLTESEPTLSGLWQQGQLSLAGPTSACTGAEGTPQTVGVRLRGQLDPAAQGLTGQIITQDGQPWSFTAQRQREAKQKVNH